MTKNDEIRVNVRTIGAMLSVIAICAGAIATAAIALDDSIETKEALKDEKIARIAQEEAHELRLDAVEKELSTWKGIIDERTRNIQANQSVMMADMKKLLENLELSDG